MKTDIMLHIPRHGMKRCHIEYGVNHIGSAQLYRLVEVRMWDGTPCDVDRAMDMNPGYSKKIAKKIHGDYDGSLPGLTEKRIFATDETPDETFDGLDDPCLF